MLSARTIATVKSTSDPLSQHGEALTQHFYKRMFEKNPEVSPFFNPAHQSAGRQQKALAAAICAYAANIDRLEALGGAVELIAQKHASLQVKPEHYPIVGENLLASIKEVLGQAATDEVIAAWGEAYGVLADILMGREKQIYHQQVAQPGGWQGFKSFRVIRKEEESAIVTSFYLVPSEGNSLPDFKPGQYITVRVPTPAGQTTMRNYSLSDKPHGDWLRISVKKEAAAVLDTPEGYVSHYLHKNTGVGDTLELGPPCGEFFLDTSVQEKRPLVFLAAGIGITPILSMLLSALSAMPEREVILVHGTLNKRVQAFKQCLDGLAKTHPNLKVYYRYSAPDAEAQHLDEYASTGIIDSQLLKAILPTCDADYYFCGPQGFMTSINSLLMSWQVPTSQVHFEFFGPRQDFG